jgi:diacylglycerol kinase (ATP)
MKMHDAVLRKESSWKKRAASFSYAWKGIKVFFQTEHNAWIHGFLTLAALCMSVVLNVSKTEFILLLFVITLVWTMEIINTAIEKAMDFISLEKHPQIKLVKDLAAAAVLVSAVAAFVTGILIFLPKLVQYV